MNHQLLTTNRESRITNAGFTLVELIIVVIIIGILAAIGLPQFTKAIETARGAEAMAGMGNLQSAEKVYFANNETYLIAGDDTNGIGQTQQKTLDINLPQNGWKFYVTNAGETSGIITAYNITAQRRAGACIGRIVTQDNKGTQGVNNWKTCVDDL